MRVVKTLTSPPNSVPKTTHKLKMDSKVCWERNDQGRGDKPKFTTAPGENENEV